MIVTSLAKFRRRDERTGAAVDEAHRVFDGHELVAVRTGVGVGSSESREDDRGVAAQQMGPVQLRGDLHGELRSHQRSFGAIRVRGRPNEVAAEADQYSCLGVGERTHRIHGVVALLARHRHAELRFERVEQLWLRAFEDAHGAVALNVAVPTDRAKSGALAPDVSAKESEVRHLVDGGHGVGVLGDAHGPADDEAPGAGYELKRSGDLGGAEPGRAKQSGFVDFCEMIGEFDVSGGVGVDEGVVDACCLGSKPVGELCVSLYAPVVPELEERLVAPEADGQVEVGDLRPMPDEPTEPLRVLEPQQAGFGKRVDGHDLRSGTLRFFERGEHAGMVAAGVLSDHQDHIRFGKVVEPNRALSDADRFPERKAGRLVAHVRTVRKVVCSEASNHELYMNAASLPVRPDV